MQLSLLQLNVSFVDHLLAFADLRQQHDQIYVQRAFPSEVRRRIEALRTPDLLTRKDGSRDREWRMRAKDGSRFVHVSTRDGPRSATLVALNTFFTPQLLEALDRTIANPQHDAPSPAASDDAALQGAVDEAVRQLHGDADAADDADADAAETARRRKKLAVKLSALSLSRLLLHCRTQTFSSTL